MNSIVTHEPGEMPSNHGLDGRRIVFSILLILNVLIVYSNYFRNDFHFDDLPAIPSNHALRDPGNIPRAFVEPDLFSSVPEQRTYRPVTVASLAVDYWMTGSQDNTFFFHLSTFVWFAVLLLLMVRLFERLMNVADPHPSNLWVALAASAAFGLHPACAETINYIIQRADLYNALGCVACVLLFARFPRQRKFGWYLLPAIAATLSKPPAIIFPLLLLAYLALFEWDGRRTLWKLVPALATAAVLGAVLVRMQPKAWQSGAVSASLYRITQPWVALHYLRSFFWPAELNVDPGWKFVSGPWSAQAMAGYLFVGLLLGAIIVAGRLQRGKPIAFGLAWFVATLLPTSLMPLKDVTNDHRMFFPFVGLSLAVFWTLRLVLFQQTRRLTVRRGLVYASMAGCAVVLVAAGVATRHRNQIWFSEETLWRDSIQKNPANVRAWTNYGATLNAAGDYETSLSSWERAAALDPTCEQCEADLVRVSIQLHRGDLAERHLQRLLSMHSPIPDAHIAYAEWLSSVHRFDDSSRVLNRAAELYPHSAKLSQARLKLLLKRDAADRIRLVRALDADQDTRLSPEEVLAAPAVLESLDKNGDGHLSAEECGADFGDENGLAPNVLQSARRAFMQSYPLLRALDSNRDGEISPAEIEEAEQRLRSLDCDHDGNVESLEMAPDKVLAAARRIFTTLDENHNERLELKEWTAAGAEYREVLRTADVDGDGIVTLEELTNEIFYRADHDRNGIVTEKELQEWLRVNRL